MAINWKQGRQGSNYYSYNIFTSKLLRSDCWLIKYPPKTGMVPAHKDPVPGRRHYRLNISLKPTKGIFQCEGPYWHWWIFTLFRPDLYTHSFFNLDDKERFVLSIGISLPEDYVEEPKWNWIPLTEEERLHGRIDYEDQMEFVTHEMAEKFRASRQASYEDYQVELKRYRESKLEFQVEEVKSSGII